MKSGKAFHGSGKTQFRRMVKRGFGKSWVELRAAAIKAGSFIMPHRQSATPVQVSYSEQDLGVDLE